ncbi:MAG: helix-turn-helix domain-containing protein [Agrobacterium cavarae]
MHDGSMADKAAKLRLDEMNRIKRLLSEAGLTLTGIDKDYRLAKGTCGNTLQQANAAGERAIAAALRVRPEHLWRTRYHGDGRRRSPQPKENYVRPPSMRDRRAAHESSSRHEAA